MGLFGKLFGQKQDDGPSLIEAWQMIGHRLAFQVEARDERSIRASGTFRGRAVTVSIEGRQVGSELLQSFATTNRKRVHQMWSTELVVSCTNPRRLLGVVEMFTDLNDPTWRPGAFDPSQSRYLRSNPTELAAQVVTPSVRDRLAPVLFDPKIDISAGAVRLAVHDRKAGLDGGYFVGSPIHVNYPNAPPALAGPSSRRASLVDRSALRHRRRR